MTWRNPAGDQRLTYEASIYEAKYLLGKNLLGKHEARRIAINI